MPAWLQSIPGLPVGLAVLGLCFGSFLNVVIHRLPRGLSLWRPRSHCPHCSIPIPAWDNIPVASYLVLRGRCRRCGGPIGIRYPLVEILGAACFLVAAFVSPDAAAAAARSVLLLALVAVFFIDLEHRIIPDVITLPGIVLGLLAGSTVGVSRLESVWGVLAGLGGLLAVALLYRAVRGVSGMGGGDIKLAGMLGAWLGWQGVVLTLLLGSMIGAGIGLGMIARGRGNMRTALPFGTFLAAAAVVVLLVGDRLWGWYVNL